MPRIAAQRRRPTVADLDHKQRELYDALPEHLRDDLLKQLPDIAVASAQGRKKAGLIRARVQLLNGVISDLQSHRERLIQLAKELDQGADPEDVDLRHLLKPPPLNGVVLRYVRAKGE
jgi:hypothetical protein